MSAQVVLIVIPVAIIVGLIIIAKTNKDRKDLVDKFLEKISDDLYAHAVIAIDSIANGEYNNFDEFRDIAIAAINRDLWDYVDIVTESLIKKGTLPEYAAKLINRELVEKFVVRLINDYALETRIEKVYIEQNKEAIESAAPNYTTTDADGNEINLLDPKNFNVEDDNEDPELEPVEESEIPEEELAKLNPKVEEDDGSQDVFEVATEDDLTPEEIEAGIHYVKNHRKRDKRGRFVKK